MKIKIQTTGMKAYKDSNDKIRLFRPKKNMARLNASCEALFFPKFDSKEFLECMFELLKLEKRWIPNEDGYSLYIRPTIISTFPFIGVAPAHNVKLYVICSPVGPYYEKGFAAVSIYGETEQIRAWPGGYYYYYFILFFLFFCCLLFCITHTHTHKTNTLK